MQRTWLNKHTKSILVDTIIHVIGTNCIEDVPISLHVKAIELDYGPVIDFEVTTSVPYTNTEQWYDHPFQNSVDYINGNTVGNIIDDTPTIRMMIQDLISNEKKRFYTSTECTYKGRLIKAIASFWS